ncbi:MAG: transposase [Desulfobacteraceae bacterium]
MTHYRRIRMEGGTYFFTVVIANRRLDQLVRHIDLIKKSLREEKEQTPFVTLGFVVLPDHIHALWRLPEGDTDYSNRWRRIKARFSKFLPPDESVSMSRKSKGERGIWQRRFWEHAIQNDKDLHRHLDYIHYNPVKHGLVKHAADWPHSTFHAYVERGKYNRDWGRGVDIDGEFGE